MSRVLPILFNTDMVRAILDGRKTVTRRCIKKLPDDAEFSGWLLDSTCQEDAKDIGSAGFKTLKQPTEKAGCIFIKPPYQPGDILYVRETWERFECWNCEGDERGNCPKEPKKSVLDKTCGCYMYRATDEISGDAKWHPSIRMPKEAARIWLKVTDVRVERLQEITDKGAEKEGAQPQNPFGYGVNEWANKENFKKIWNSTLKKSDLDRYGWEANPWVWAIEFERCEKPEVVQNG